MCRSVVGCVIVLEEDGSVGRLRGRWKNKLTIGGEEAADRYLYSVSEKKSMSKKVWVVVLWL